jgi:outer membrane murein-binding lipoprotein Lpp
MEGPVRSTFAALLCALMLGGCAGAEVTRLENEVEALKQRVQTLEQRVKKLEAAGPARGKAPANGGKGGKGKSAKGKQPVGGGTKAKTKQPGKAKTKQPARGGGDEGIE